MPKGDLDLPPAPVGRTGVRGLGSGVLGYPIPDPRSLLCATSAVKVEKESRKNGKHRKKRNEEKADGISVHDCAR